MQWNDQEARFARWLGRIGLSLQGTLIDVNGKYTSTYSIRSGDRTYCIGKQKTFASIEQAEDAFLSQMPVFRIHAACAHQLLLRYFDKPDEQAAVDEWIRLEANPKRKPIQAGWPWSSAETRMKNGHAEYLRTFGPPWTGWKEHELPHPEWSTDDVKAAHFDPSRPTVYLESLRRLLDSGETHLAFRTIAAQNLTYRLTSNLKILQTIPDRY